MAKAKTKPEAEVPPPAPVVNTAVTHAVALDPRDWFLAPWRNTPPLARPQPAPYDLNQCVERMSRMRAGTYTQRWPWDTLGLADTLSREEAQFWLMAMTWHGRDSKPLELALYLKRQGWDGRWLLEDLKSRFRSKADQHAPELLIPLANLLSPVEVVNLLLLDIVGDQKSQPSKRLETVLNLAEGFARHLLPYLTAAEREEIKPLLRPHLDPSTWTATYWGAFPPCGVYLAAALGMSAELLPLIQNSTEKQFARPGTTYSVPQHIQTQLILYGLSDPGKVCLHMRRLKLLLQTEWQIRGWLAHTELTGLDLIRDSILSETDKNRVAERFRAFTLVQAPEAAPFMLELKFGSRVPGLARQWLDEQVGNAVAGLLPLTTGRGKVADAALDYLRDAKRKGHAAVIEEQLQGAAPEVADKVRAVLEHEEKLYEPLDDYSTSPEWLQTALAALESKGNLPDWAQPILLPPVLVSDRCLNEDQVRSLLLALHQSPLAVPRPLIKAVKQHADRTSLDAFAWKLFEAWHAEGMDSREKWAFQAVGHFGSDASALKLTPLVRAWPGEGGHARAVLGLECLRAIGTDTALMQLNGISQKLRFQGLRNKAQQFMEDIARDKGLSRTELEDRIVPDLDLDARGSRVFDFGPRQFKLVFGEGMKPLVRDDQGKVKTDLPKPGVKDDGDKAKAAVDAWKLLKKQVKEVLKAQVGRLENAMVSCRRWPVADFEKLLVKQPLMINLVRLLLWGGYDHAAKLVRTFRVTEEQEYASREDTPCGLEGLHSVGVVHPLHLTDEERAAWGEVFSDYEIVPPFPQLGRRVQTLQPGEEDEPSITRFNGPKIEPLVLVGILEKTGWTRGDVLDGGVFHEHYRYFPGADTTAILGYEDGIPVGYMDGWHPQTLDGCVFVRGQDTQHHRHHMGGRPLRLGEVDPVVLSEVLDVMSVLASKGT